jgi:hypothetical protein
MQEDPVAKAIEEISELVRAMVQSPYHFGPLEIAIKNIFAPKVKDILKTNGVALQLLKPDAEHKLVELQRQIEVLARQEKVQRDMIGVMRKELSEKTTLATALGNEVAILRDGAQYPTDAKFKAAKREFAKRYHPHSDKSTGEEKRIRTAAFVQFWEVLEEIEKTTPI